MNLWKIFILLITITLIPLSITAMEVSNFDKQDDTVEDTEQTDTAENKIALLAKITAAALAANQRGDIEDAKHLFAMAQALKNAIEEPVST